VILCSRVQAGEDVISRQTWVVCQNLAFRLPRREEFKNELDGQTCPPRIVGLPTRISGSATMCSGQAMYFSAKARSCLDNRLHLSRPSYKFRRVQKH
jgi:hypothetical protein